MSNDKILKQRQQAEIYFQDLRDRICAAFELIEQDHGDKNAKFQFTKWERGENEGGGVMSKMKGKIFQKVGVNVSQVWRWSNGYSYPAEKHLTKILKIFRKSSAIHLFGKKPKRSDKGKKRK